MGKYNPFETEKVRDEGWYLKGSAFAADLLEREIDTIPMLWDFGIPRKGISILAGSSDTGKSCFLRNLAIEYSLNMESYLGYTMRGDRRSVVYVSTEDDDDAISVLLKKHLRGREIEHSPTLLFIFSLEELYDKIKACIEKVYAHYNKA
jgi:RecA-family ATPase